MQQSPIPEARRTLRAVLISDVCKFSTAVSNDEEPVILRVNEDLQMFRQICVESHGLVSEDRGDGLKMVFESPVQAAKAAIEMQRQVRLRNAQRTNGEPFIQHRMGMHFGDVMVLGQKVTGHAVTVAARLEAQAVPGELCFSDDVQRQIKSATHFARRYVGQEQVKNLAEPLRTWMSMEREDMYVPAEPKVVQANAERIIRDRAVAEFVVQQKEKKGKTALIVVLVSFIFTVAVIGFYMYLQGTSLPDWLNNGGKTPGVKKGSLFVPSESGKGGVTTTPGINVPTAEDGLKEGGKHKPDPDNPQPVPPEPVEGEQLAAMPSDIQEKIDQTAARARVSFDFDSYVGTVSSLDLEKYRGGKAYVGQAGRLIRFWSWYRAALKHTETAPLRVDSSWGLSFDKVAGVSIDGAEVRLRTFQGNELFIHPFTELSADQTLRIADALAERQKPRGYAALRGAFHEFMIDKSTPQEPDSDSSE